MPQKRKLLSLTPNLWNQNPHFNKIPSDLRHINLGCLKDEFVSHTLRKREEKLKKKIGVMEPPNRGVSEKDK